jgi:hypothetical protein
VSAVGFVTFALVALALGSYVGVGELHRLRERRRRERPASARRRARRMDPGVERRAERRARELLRSIVNPEEWEMYRDLGFIRVVGQGPATGSREGDSRRARGGADSAVSPTVGFCFVIYPHKPIVAYLPGSNSLLSEYCVEFPDREAELHGPKLPDSDDVLAKWMMIKADEERLLRDANMHLPGRQVDPQQVRRDLWRLAEWERARSRATQGREHPAGTP